MSSSPSLLPIVPEMGSADGIALRMMGSAGESLLPKSLHCNALVYEVRTRTALSGQLLTKSVPGDASAQEHCQGSDGAPVGSSLVLDVAKWLRVFAVVKVRFVRGKARNLPWREVERRELDWASRSLKREFEEVIMVEVLIEEMVRSD